MKFNIEKFLPIFVDRLEKSFFWIRDPKLEKQLYLSPSFEAIWGMRREEVYKDPLAWAKHVDTSDYSAHNAKNMLDIHTEEGESAKFQSIYRIQHPEKGLRWIKDSSFPLYEEGVCIGFAGIAEDITNEKEYEAELKRQKNLAEVANVAKTAFIANMSHDVRTAITGMLGLTHSWKERSTTPEDSEDSVLMEDCTKELLNLFNEVIDIIKIDNGQMEQNICEFSLSEVIKHNITLLMPAAKDKKIKLISEIPENIPVSYIGKKILLDRVLLNLISNAIKFTKEGEIAIKVSLDSLKENTATLKISVTDTGIGIPEDKLEEIFNKFARLTPSYQGIYKGTGLGLYTVKQFTKMLNGKIEVSSEINKGSQFTLILPLQTATSEKTKTTNKETYSAKTNNEKEAIPTSVKEDSVEKSPKKESTIWESPLIRVLVVEDNPLAARTARNLLENANCAVDIAYTGEDGLQCVKDNDYQLIFMDIGLPGKSGMEITQLIRKLEDNKSKIPIVALTGHVDTERKEECTQAGIDDVINKPLTPELAKEHLQRWVVDSTIEEEKPLVAIDLDLGARIMGNKEAAKQIVFAVGESLVEYAPKARSAYEAKDYDSLASILQEIHSGLCYCGAPELTEKMKALRDALTEESTEEEIAHKYQQFEEAIGNFHRTSLELWQQSRRCYRKF